MKLRCMQNSGYEGLHMTRVMTIFGFYVGRHFTNIQYFDVYKGIWRYIKLFEAILMYIKVYEGV